VIAIHDNDTLFSVCRIKNLVMITSKQDKLETINTFAVYDWSKTVFTSNAEYPFVFLKSFISSFKQICATHPQTMRKI